MENSELGPKKKRSHLKNFFKTNRAIFLSGLALLVLMFGSLYYHFYHQPIVPVSIKTQSRIPILYPTKLPPGFSLVKSSFSITDEGVVTYYAEDSSRNKIIFTVQERPASFDFDKFYSESLSNSTKFTTPLGEAAVGSASGQLLGSLATDKSWVIITSLSKIVDAGKIRTILGSINEAN